MFENTKTYIIIMVHTEGVIKKENKTCVAGMGDNPWHGAAGGSGKSFDNAVEVGG